MNLTRAHSAHDRFYVFSRELKKGKMLFLIGFEAYGRFLVTRIASTAPITIMMMAMATIPNMSVVFEAKLVAGAGVGAGVAAGLLA